MNLIELKCSNCKASMEADLDNLQVYCPYCGQKLLIDMDKLNEVLKAKERTRQEEEMTRRAGLFR